MSLHELLVDIDEETVLPLGLAPSPDVVVFNSGASLVLLPANKQVAPEHLILEFREEYKPPLTLYLSVDEETKRLILEIMEVPFALEKLFDPKRMPSVKNRLEFQGKIITLMHQIESLPESKRRLLKNIVSHLTELLDDPRF